MAIIFEGQSKCPLCNELLNSEKEFTMFPHFSTNIKDPISVFSDAGVHVSCVNNHPLGEKALSCRDKYHASLKLIKTPGTIATLLLTSNESEPLYAFNFLTIEKTDLGQWKEKSEFIAAASAYNNDGKWESLTDFNFLDHLVREVNNK